MPKEQSTIAMLKQLGSTQRRLEVGEALFTQATACFGVFELEAGAIRLSRVTPSGSEVTMHQVAPGELFAEASLFSPRYHCDAIAMRKSTVKVYSKSDLINHFQTDVESLWSFAEGLAHQVQGLRTRLTLRQIRSAKDRIVQVVQLRSDKTGLWQHNRTLKSIADELGLTHEAFYRALADLEASGAIIRSLNSLMHVDRERSTSR